MLFVGRSPVATVTTISEPTVLLSVDVSETPPPVAGLSELLAPLSVVVLGYHPVPDQAVPAQTKRDHGDEAASRLDEVAAAVPDGRTVTTTLVFTHDRDETVDRLADGRDCTAVATPGAADATVERLLVALRGETNLDQICSFVADLLADDAVAVTLAHAHEGDTEGGQRLLGAAADRLAAAGLDPGRVDRRLLDGDPNGAVAAAADDADALVIGETKPSLRERILGATPTRIDEAVDVPVLVVRRS